MKIETGPHADFERSFGCNADGAHSVRVQRLIVHRAIDRNRPYSFGIEGDDFSRARKLPQVAWASQLLVVMAYYPSVPSSGNVSNSQYERADNCPVSIAKPIKTMMPPPARCRFLPTRPIAPRLAMSASVK